MYCGDNDGNNESLINLHQINVPVLVIHGDSDEIVPLPAGQELQRKILTATFYCISGMGHGIAGNRDCQSLINRWLISAQSNHTSKL
mmetsp:Transcript_22971/g.29341  ORF Transcript_22971/g.29341 Transcript_22971/m.29341 type:complete len:87 (-) Transcript_22971:1941-2201(-)